MQLAKNFSLSEWTQSETASRRGIPNTPTVQAVVNGARACETIAQPTRNFINKHTGAGLHISSGYRDPQLNAAIGGSITPISAHTDGRALDLKCHAIHTASIALLIHALNLPYDKLILEYADPQNADAGWVHVQMRKNYGEPRRLIFIKDGRRNYAPTTPQKIAREYPSPDPIAAIIQHNTQ